MNDKTQALQEDIAFMRDMAEAGASTPIVSGQALVSAGAVFGSLSLAQFLWLRFGAPAGWMLASMWIAGCGLFVAYLMLFLLPRILRKPGIASPANRAVGYTWNATGWTINVSLAATLILSWRLDSSLPFVVFPSVIAAIYGGAWLTTQRMSGQAWMRWPMFGSFAFALLLALLIKSPYLWLVFSAAFILVALIPGVVLMRKEPSPVV